MKRLIILTMVVGSGVAFYLFADLESLSSAILSMPTESLVALLVLLGSNEIVKGLRWAFFLRASNLEIRTIDGLTSYLAAQAATALPGGSVLTARLAQEHGTVRMHQAAAGLLGQGIADIVAIGLLAAAAILLTQQRPIQLLVPFLALVFAGAAIAVIRSARLAHWLTNLLMRWRITRRFVPEEEDFREHAAILMKARTLAIGTGYSLGSTAIAASILLVIVTAMTERGVSPGEAVYAHSLSTVARLVVPVPGGFGVSDGSLAGLLNYIGIGLARATFVALGYRSVGLLFRTSFGLLMLIARYPYLLVGQLRVPSGRPARLPSRRRLRAASRHEAAQHPASPSAISRLGESDSKEIIHASYRPAESDTPIRPSRPIY